MTYFISYKAEGDYNFNCEWITADSLQEATDIATQKVGNGELLEITEKG